MKSTSSPASGLFRRSQSSRNQAAELAATPPSAMKRKAQTPEFDCPLVGRVPKLQKTGDWAEDAKRETQRDDFIALLNLLWFDETVISPCLGYVRRLRDKALEASDAFIELPSCFGKIPKDFIACWLSSLHNKFSSDWLDIMDCADDSFIHGLMCLLTGLSPTMPLHKALISKSLLRDLLQKRADELNRVEKAAANVKFNGYDRLAGGVFELKFEGEQVAGITHISGVSVKVPSHVSMTKAFAMVSWYSDSHCALSLAPVKFVLRDFFPAASMDAAIPTKKQVDAMVARLAQAREEKEAADSTIVPDSILAKSKQKKTEQLKQQAKATMEKNKVAKLSRSQVKLA